MRFNVVINNENTGVLYFPATIASPDDVFYRIQTDAF